MDTERYLTVGAVLFELCIPVLAIVLGLRVPRFRNVAVVVLGAVSPLLLAYAYVTVMYLIDQTDKDFSWSFHTMWVMSFFVYAGLFIVGMLLGLVPKPTHPLWRFAIGFTAGLFPYALLILPS